MSGLIFIITFLVMSMINKYVLEQKNSKLSIFISLVVSMLFFKFGIGVEFFKFAFLTLILTIVSWIDFKTQDVYTSDIIIGAIGGIFFIGLNIFLKNGFNIINIISFLVFVVGIGVIGAFDVKCGDERIIYGSLVCIYLLYFFVKGDLNFINIFSACVIPSLAIGAISLMGLMGWGDVEVVFICGLFLNFRLALLNLFIGIVLAGIHAVYLILFRRKNGAIALVPYLAFGAGITVLFGEQIINWYINLL